MRPSIEQNSILCPGAAIYPHEREWLKTIAKIISANFAPAPITIVNIGIMWGATMWALRAGAPDARLIGIDININRDADHTVYKQSELDAEFIEADSTIYSGFADPIHILFIDGCHYEHTVSADIRTWSPHVVIGGIMAFHDYNPTPYDLQVYPDLVGVRNAVDKWRASAVGWEHYTTVGSIIAFRRTSFSLSIPVVLHIPHAEVEWLPQTA